MSMMKATKQTGYLKQDRALMGCSEMQVAN